MNFRSLYLLLLVLATLSVCGQTGGTDALTPKILPNAPNSASLGKFGDYQVNMFSGVPDISIPLYNIKSGDLEVPITLSYHASGVKVSDFASWVGLGWGLHAGGEIRRKLMGGPDEESGGYLTNQTRATSAIDVNTNDGVEYLRNVNYGQIDAQPDIFSYDFPGKNGKFFFNPSDNYNPALIPYSPIRISKSYSTGSLKFNVLDEHGNAFNFGYVATESTNSTNGGQSIIGTSAWMLDNMISANKSDTISFVYGNMGSLVADDQLYSWVMNDKVTLLADNPDDGTPGLVYTANPSASVTATTSSAIVSEKPITEIGFKNGKVVFELSPTNRVDFALPGTYNCKPLSKIKVYSYDQTTSSYQLIKIVALFQSYFISGTDALTKRLRLDSVQIQDQSGLRVQAYKFDYNTAIALPVRSSLARDFWGYYNGKANTTLIPRTDITDYVLGVNLAGTSTVTIGSSILNGRDPDTSYMQAGVLKRVYYPTGGYTDFQYETNQYKDIDNNVKYAGGLRIKSIKSYDGLINTPLVKTFKYGSDELGNGRANFTLSNYYLKTEQTYRRWVFMTAGPVIGQTMRVRTFLSNPTIEIEPFDGTPVAYPYVTEYLGDETTNIGKTVYQFRDRGDALGTATFVKPSINSYFYERGQLANKKVFKKIASSFQPVQEESYTYSAFAESLYFAGLLVKADIMDDLVVPVCCGNYNNIFLFTNYPINSDDNYMTSKTVTVYDPDDVSKFVKTTTNLSYGNITHQQPTKTTLITSRGDTMRSVSKYPADYILSGNTKTNNLVLDTMLAKNMQANVIEKWDSLIKPEGNKLVTGGNLSVYTRLSSGVIALDNSKKLRLDAPVNDFQPSSISSGNLINDSRYLKMVSFDNYDVNNNISQYTLKSSALTSYLWDYGGTLPIAEVKNAPITDIAYTSFEAEGKGNWMFSGNPVTDATAPTGKRSYNLTPSLTLTKSGLSASTVYVVSYWSKNASAFTINGTQAGYPLTGRTVGAWKYFEHHVTGQTSIVLTGTGTIDEVRLYPANAQMVTMTHFPLLGITSQCDQMNKITYYEYDPMGRLMLLRDQDKSILKTFEYNYKK